MRKQILLIEDDLDDRWFFRTALQKIDETIECTFVSHCVDALKLLDKQDSKVPDFIFLDLNMPLISGKECLKSLKNIEAFRSVPIIIISTSQSPKDMDETQELGADGYIAKPCLIDEWKRQLEKVLKR